MTSTVPGHDIITVGASSGGVEALQILVAGLPADLRAAVFVVIHTQAGHVSHLPDILSRRGPLRARHAIHGERIEQGRIYVAPPDNHMMLRSGFMSVARGPKENGHRPSVDALFRSAARSHGPRVIGVVLTGHLDCGTAGLLSIKARGGVAVVQDPRDAKAQEMPASAINHVEVDHVVALAELPALLTELVAQPVGELPAHLPASIMELEGDELGVSADLVCPLCQGKLTEAELNGFQQFRCHVGHSFSLEAVVAEQSEEVERVLWAAVRALDESATLAARLADRSAGDLRNRFAEKQEALAHQAQLLRRVLLGDAGLTVVDSPLAK